jgi:phage terminase large subunit
MSKITIKKRVFNPVYFSFLNCLIPTQIFFGGASSGKSRFVIGQRAILDLIRFARNYLIVRNVQNTIRTSVWNELLQGINSMKMTALFDVSKSERVVTCKTNRAQVICHGLDDVEKIKSIIPLSGVITDIVREEATEMSADSERVLGLRLRGKTAHVKRNHYLFNPISRQHHLYKKYFKNFTGKIYKSSDLLILKTTHLDNNFLTPQDHATIEAYKDVDPYVYEVYAKGNWGTLGNCIFHNWRTEDLSDRIDKFDYYRNGLDFGYTNDPAAIVRSSMKGDTIYICAEFYMKGQSNTQLAAECKRMLGREQVYCDCAEPKSIQDLRNEGVNAFPVVKGKDSVIHGIEWLKTKKLVVHYACQNTVNELSLMQWKKDKAGEPINVPIDAFNHIIDALRYSYEREMTPGAMPGMEVV